VDSNRFDILLDEYVSGAAAPAEAAELGQLLQTDAALRRQFADRLLLEIHLRKAYAAAAPTGPIEHKRQRSWRVVVGWMVAAVVLFALGVGLLSWFNRGPVTARGNEVLAGEVYLDGVALEQLPEEKPFEVAAEAPAVIRLADGSKAEIAPASKATIHGPRDSVRQAVELERGGGKFAVVPGNGQFRVETAAGNVTVLGTEFSVKLETRSRGEGKRGGRARTTMTVAVTEGSVKVDSAGKSYVLAAGERRVFPERTKREEEDD
jgi:ferric-dicitrate binding protein FerR (iron transport regulator)